MYTFNSDHNINDKIFVLFEGQVHKAIVRNVIFIDGGVEYKVQIDNPHIFESKFLHVSSSSVASSIIELNRRWKQNQDKMNGVSLNE